MPLLLLRRAASQILAIALASVVSFGAAGFGHSGWDFGCEPAPTHHDHNAHRVRAGTLPNNEPDHCLFCHLSRSLGNGLVATHAPVVDSARSSHFRASYAVLVGRLLDENTPSRAPPSVLL